MGQVVLGAGPCVLTSVLGSCVGVTLYDPVQRCGALAHIVLPCDEGRTAAPGKFANTAVPYMIELLEAHGSRRWRLQAKVFGGATMFAAQGPLHIGEANIQATAAALAEAGATVIGQHYGGRQGRRIRFDTDTGAVTVQIAGAPLIQI
jgi:chemotaxis protein CheD